MLSVFPAHAPADSRFAKELSQFLEAGCDAVCGTAEALIRPGQDIISLAGEGISADVLVLLLSRASSPPKWRRERWEPILFEQADELNTRVATLLLEDCVFPDVLRRKRTFFNATGNKLAAMRQLKRWIRGIHSETNPPLMITSDLDVLYDALADRPGMCTASGPMAERFADEAAPDFDGVFWIPAYGRTLAQIAGELGQQMQMKLDGQLEENCRRIRELLSSKRCLVVLDAPDASVEAILPSGRSSILITSEPVRVFEQAPSLGAARALVSASRFAEAHEMLYPLLHAGVDVESCARQLVWICEHWDRLEEANQMRFHFGPSPSEQLRLFQT